MEPGVGGSSAAGRRFFVLAWLLLVLAWLGGVALFAGQPRVAAAFNNLSLGLAVVWYYERCASRTIQKGLPTFANSKPRVRVFLLRFLH